MFNILHGPIQIILEYVSIREYYVGKYWILNKNISIAWEIIFKMIYHKFGCKHNIYFIQRLYYPHGTTFDKPASKTGWSLNLMNLLLMDETFDPSDSDNFWIRWSCRNGYKHIADRLLLDWRVNPGHFNNRAIKDALKNGHIDIYRRLLIDWRTKSNDDYYYLISISIGKGLIDITEELLTKYNGKIYKLEKELCAECSSKDYDIYKYDPIITAVESNNIKFTQKLISNNIEEDYLPYLVNQLLDNSCCRVSSMGCKYIKIIEFLVDNYDINYIFYHCHGKYFDNYYRVLRESIKNNQWSLIKKIVLNKDPLYV